MTIIQIVRHNRPMLARGLDCLQNQLWGRVTQRRKYSARVQPADSDFPEDMFPIKIARFELACSRVSAIGNPDRAPHNKCALGKTEASANRTPPAVEGNPLDKSRVHTALQDEIFNQTAHLVVS